MTAARGSAGTRLEQARVEIAQRRSHAEAATAGPWSADDREVWQSADQETVVVRSWVDENDPDIAHIAANDPAHVLAVLAAADATLDRHAVAAWWDPEFMDDGDPAPCGTCTYDARRVVWPCPDAAAVLDVYAPEPA
ncbi:MAG: hypothetical protein JWP11_3688 [Frankiales bacterium]|nr:hypothetical protein [Frankiales bacterium]